jgi:iron(III) transport system substrate-binding protein
MAQLLPCSVHLRALASAALVAVLLACCSRRPAPPGVILYSSADDALIRLISSEFTRRTGIDVKIVGDTEATKTTGLVERLIAEKPRPRADVWWSSEPFGTIRLSQEGLLAPIPPEVASALEPDWPAALRAAPAPSPEDTWRGFASRVRVIVYSTTKLKDEPPRTLQALTEPRLKGRIGMARPQFGTTRGQMGALLAAAGEPAFRAWIQGLRANGVRLYDGNSAVVRAVAYGEIDAGLTDSDDVYAGQREGWAVDRTLAPAGFPPPAPPIPAMLLPNTAALVRGGPHPEQGAGLLKFLLSPDAERLLAKSESRNIPWRPALAKELGLELPAGLASLPDLDKAAASTTRAVSVCDELLR